jgi:hypothetical protein
VRRVGIFLFAVTALAGCGATQTIKPKGVAVEPAIVACNYPGPAECAAAHEAELAHTLDTVRCPVRYPYVVVNAEGHARCVARLPSGPTSVAVEPPAKVRARGQAAVLAFEQGAAVLVRSGCLACQRLAESGNAGPGRDLMHVGAGLPVGAIDRVLTNPQEPMPSFRRMPLSERRALVAFLSELR